MLKQLDLFGAPMDEPSKPSPARKRLTPPKVVELEPAADESKQEPTAEDQTTLTQPDRTETPDEYKTITVAEEISSSSFGNDNAQVVAESMDDVTPIDTVATVTESDPVTTYGEPVELSPKTPVETESTTDDLPRKSTRGRKSLKEMSREAALVEIPDDTQLYSKHYYGIGEVAAMFNVNASLLRFWEAEFDILKPRKNKKGDQFFRPEDIKNLQLIHHLLRERKYTIDGAREFLRKSGKRKEQFEAIESLKKLRAFLVEMKAGL